MCIRTYIHLNFARGTTYRQGVSDRLVIRREENLVDWLGNPCPGVLKALRIRYVSLEGVAKGRRREVWFQESEVRARNKSLVDRVSSSASGRVVVAKRVLFVRSTSLRELLLLFPYVIFTVSAFSLGCRAHHQCL